MTDDGSERTALGSAELAASVPSEVLLVPWGVVESANGTFVVDEEAARLVLATFASQRTDLPIDYEHQTLGGEYASPTGQAPAAGWIKRLFVRRAGDGGSAGSGPEAPSAGLYAEVEWTEAARRRLAGKEYRYLSPVAIVRKRDRRLVALHSAALTNKPAIMAMRAIVNRSDGAIGRRGDGEASESEGQRMAEAMERLRGQLGLEAGAEGEAVLLAASERLAALTETVRRGEAEAMALAAMRAGKLTEGQREWAIVLAMRDPEAFAAWERSAPVVVQTGRITEERPYTEDAERGRAVIAAKARAEFRAHPALAVLTSEEAYIAMAVRGTDAR